MAPSLLLPHTPKSHQSTDSHLVPQRAKTHPPPNPHPHGHLEHLSTVSLLDWDSQVPPLGVTLYRAFLWPCFSHTTPHRARSLQSQGTCLLKLYASLFYSILSEYPRPWTPGPYAPSLVMACAILFPSSVFPRMGTILGLRGWGVAIGQLLSFNLVMLEFEHVGYNNTSQTWMWLWITWNLIKIQILVKGHLGGSVG